jgi:hypothetical protein
MLGLDEEGRPLPRTGPSTARHVRRESGWWRYGFPAVMTVLVLSIPTLVWLGSRVVLGSNEGRVVERVTDPAAPGFEAVVDATPVALVVGLDEAGALDGLTVLTLTSDGNGGVVQLPRDTVMGVPGIGNIPLSVVYRTSGLEVLREGVEGILNVGIPTVEVVGAEEWADLLAPVAPLEVQNPDPVVGTNVFGVPEVLHPAGRVILDREDVWPFLAARAPGANDLSLMVRREAFWRAWLAEVRADPDAEGVVPGEVDSGLGRFVRRLARDDVEFTTLPVRAQTYDDGTRVAFEPDIPAVEQLVARLIPFPAGPEGKRARLAVLDGTGRLDNGLGAAVVLARAGGQVQKVGNAAAFDVPLTRIVYYDEAVRPFAERFREALGVGEVVRSDELNAAVDVTVTLGTDFEQARPDVVAPPLSVAPVSAGAGVGGGDGAG